ncbi:probable ATP-dependent RNA helicase DDX56 [Planococcus citri]|uniref:probable ATP-dependent RNA helicase DDX56 n=1 Tax=Planococcus citri TaxID=170843 RepID=UPI0031F758A5
METSNELQFHKMGLDDRIIKAIAKLGWENPTAIQEKAIPLLLEGKGVLMRGRTGSGKTGAFAIPVIQKVLLSNATNGKKGTRAMILAPSKELCNQIFSNIKELTCKCSDEVSCVDISAPVDLSVQKPLLVDQPNIIVATPSRAVLHLEAHNLSVKNTLEMLIIDEADLMFSVGHENVVDKVLSHLPKVYQAVLASATLTEDVVSLKKSVLRHAVILKLEEPNLAPLTQLTHFYVNAEEEEKAVILYTLLKLSLLTGKSIIFVNTVDRCYKLKLFLEQFGISTCVLNSELPAASRCHSVSQFNDDVYKIIIASDEKALEEDFGQSVNKTGKRKRDKESGVARGIDFQFVSNVVNFDFPLDAFSYVHRAGRTARGTNKGIVLSFVSVREQYQKADVEDYLKECLREDCDIFQKFKFSLQEVDGFRYRAKDAWKAVTRIAVREARLKEIKQEILNSKKLKRYFDENPRDFQTLRHDKALHTVKLQDHLTDVPDYIVPPSLKNIVSIVNDSKKKPEKVKFKTGRNKAFNKYVAKKKNPLLSMEFSGLESIEDNANA